MPRAKNPEVGDRMLEAAARVLAEEGPAAVTARRLAAEVGASTMAVYTHFGSMDELLVRLWRLGFTRFGEALDGPSVTGDPVADWATQGWAYRRFAHGNRHLYRVMFDDGLVASKVDQPADQEAAMATFVSLLTRLQRCADAGRWVIDDVQLAGEAVWAGVHGAVSIEFTGYFRDVGRDAEAAYAETMRRLALGFGDDAQAVAHSLAVAQRRARRVSSRSDQRSVSVDPSAQAVSTS
ncbi:MAG: TetR/AcrR family transcriptional regulator [Ilumatobacteraceae bacterium]